VARRTRFLALIAGLIAVVACGGGGGGGSPTQPAPSPSPPPPQPQIVFTSNGNVSGVVLARATTSTATTLVLEVRASEVSGLYGVAFDLTYPSAVLRYRAAHTGPFLGAGSVEVSTQVAETSPGHLVVGVSRLGQSGGVDGSGLLLSLDFDAVAAGSGAFSFSKNSAFRPDGSPQQVGWSAGTVTVVR